MGQDELPAEDMAMLREAVLGFYEESVTPLVGQRRRRMARRLHRLRLRRLNGLLLPWRLVGLVYMVATRRALQVVARQQRAVSLYRQISGKDPRVAEAEVGRVKDQLMAIDERIKPYGARLATAGATADWAELEAAAGALLAYHLRGRQTDDGCWASSRQPGRSTRPPVPSARTRCSGRLPGTSGHRRRRSAARSGRRRTDTLRGGVVGLTGTPSWTPRRIVTADAGLWRGGSNRWRWSCRNPVVGAPTAGTHPPLSRPPRPDLRG